MPDRRRRRPGRAGTPIRITDAQTSRAEELAARQRRYLWSMAVRTVCFVAAVAVGPGPLRWVLVAGAICLPYIAVVMANAADTRADHFLLTPPQSGAAELPPTEPKAED